MSFRPVILGLALLVPLLAAADLPTYYEYYTSDGIESGLSADQPTYFLLNGKNFLIYSGAMHYFRVPRAYWRDRLKKIRAAGLNTVETYISWNIHEPENGLFEFGESGSEMEEFANLEEFLKIAQEEDLFVILRSGPFICAEYNFGGFPSWLLREEHVVFRTMDETFMKYVSRYYDHLLPILAKYQFTRGGPIILFQLENEYGNQGLPDMEYLRELHEIFVNHSIVELLSTADSPNRGTHGTIPELFFLTANLGAEPEALFEKLLETQPNRPVMVMEYWMGWYDMWGEGHAYVNAGTKKTTFEKILKYPASANIYMFLGGTSFGFTNGAYPDNGNNSGLEPFTTSYDYEAPLTEGGDYTDQYFNIKELVETYNPVKTATPDVPKLEPKVAYPTISIEKEILFSDLIEKEAPYVFESEDVVPMEKLDINNGSGQSNGYILYRKENVDLPANTVLKIGGKVCDVAIVSVNGARVSASLESKDDFDKFGFWRLKDGSLELNSKELKGATLDILVENWGRINAGKMEQYNQTFKGLWQGDVYLNDKKVSGWKIVPLEFKKSWTNNLNAWSKKTSSSLGPVLYQATLEISDEPKDSYIDMRKWTKGLVVINGFPLGKYAKIGPQQTLYLPAPFLKKGTNTFVVFEQYKGADNISFVTQQIFAN